MDLTSQQPADGVMKLCDSMYRIACNCSDPAHDVTLSIDLDDHDFPSITFYTHTTTTWWKQHFPVTYTEAWPVLQAKMFLNALINKIALVYTVLFKGKIEFETVAILSRRQCLTVAEILLKADEVALLDRPEPVTDRVDL